MIVILILIVILIVIVIVIVIAIIILIKFKAPAASAEIFSTYVLSFLILVLAGVTVWGGHGKAKLLAKNEKIDF